MIEEWRLERSRTQMTLGQLIERLNHLHPSVTLCIGYPHSYRGYYSDLAFEQSEVRTVDEILKEVEGCLGKEFTGYKGGEYTMDESTPVWIAEYGSAGVRLMAIGLNGSLVTAEEEDS